MQNDFDDYDAVNRELDQLRETMLTGLKRIDLRLDHFFGWHELAVADGCPTCERKATGHEA